VLLAMTFHKSAFIIALLYPVYHINITRKKSIFAIPVIVFVYLNNKAIFAFIFRFMSDDMEERYNEISETGAYSMIILFALFAVFAYVCTSNELVDRDFIGLRNLLLLSVVLQLFVPINAIAMRMNYYFIIFIPILIPKVIHRTPKSDRTLYEFLGVFLSAFFIFYYFRRAMYGVDILQTYPYRFFWQTY